MGRVFAARELTGVPAFDTAIDFSLPEGFDPLLELCVARGAALVSGTTGLSDSQRAALDAAAMKIPLLWASNFSLGVAVLAELVERAATALPGWDCECLSPAHEKKDAPSAPPTLGEAAIANGARSLRPRAPAISSAKHGSVQLPGLTP